MTSIDEFIDVIAVVVTSALVVMVATGQTGPVRLVLALGFVTFVPGWAFLDHVAPIDRSRKAALAVAASFTICAIPALALLWARTWRPVALLHVLAVASLVALLASIARSRRAAR